MCVCRWPLRLKLFPQYSHLYGLSPVWVRMCVCRLPLWLKSFRQSQLILLWEWFSKFSLINHFVSCMCWSCEFWLLGLLSWKSLISSCLRMWCCNWYNSLNNWKHFWHLKTWGVAAAHLELLFRWTCSDLFSTKVDPQPLHLKLANIPVTKSGEKFYMV